MKQGYPEMLDLAKRAAKGCHIQFQSGQSVNQGWFELVGDGVSLLRELLVTHGDRGLAEFKAQFGPMVVERLQGKIEDYDKTQDMKSLFTDLLDRYQRGQPIEVFIPIGPPITGLGRPINEELAIRRLPTGRPVVFEKPADESRQDQTREVRAPTA